jgi:anti-sigma factor RsiW
MTDQERPVTDDDLHAFVDGVLDAGRRPAVERHLAAHPEAAARVAAWQAVGASLREATAWKAREPVPARLDVGRLLAARRARRWQPARVAAGILVALAVGAGSGWMARGPSMPTGVASVAMEAASVHRMFAAGGEYAAPRDAAARTELTSWLSRQLGRPATPPDLSGSGFHLVGGQLVATDQGPGGMYLYDGPRGVRITLFMRPMKKRDMNASMRPMHRADTEGYVWAQNGLGFSLVTSEPMEMLHGLANQIRSDMGARI